MYSIMLSADTGSFTSSFPIWMPFISFSSLIAWVGLPKLLSNIGESGHPCVVPHLRGNAFSFSPLRRMLGFVVYGLYYVEVPTTVIFKIEVCISFRNNAIAHLIDNSIV